MYVIYAFSFYSNILNNSYTHPIDRVIIINQVKLSDRNINCIMLCSIQLTLRHSWLPILHSNHATAILMYFPHMLRL